MKFVFSRAASIASAFALSLSANAQTTSSPLFKTETLQQMPIWQSCSSGVVAGAPSLPATTPIVCLAMAAGDLVYGGVGGAATRLPAGTSSQVLISGTTPTWGSVNIATMVSGLGAGFANAAAIATNANGGFPTVSVSATAPATPSLFQPWLNTTATPYVWNIWDGASWVAIGTINATTHAIAIPLTNIAPIPADTILGNGTAGSAAPAALTALPSTFTGTSGHVLPYLDGANIWTPIQLFNGGIGGSISYTGAQVADFFPNNFTLTFNALSNPGHNNYGFGPTCIVASTSYRGQLLCNYAVLNVNSLGSVGYPDDQFVGQAAWVTGNANTTDVDASLFGANDNVTINGAGWVYAVGREIDVTATKAITNKMGLRVVYGTADAFRGSGTYDNMLDLINAGSAGGRSILSVTQLGTGTFDNILVVNAGVVTPGGRIVTSPSANIYEAGQFISGASGGTTSAAFQAIAATPVFAWEASGGGPDSKWWQAIGGSAAWTLSAVNDLGSAANVALQINRSGYTITDMIAGARTYPSVDNSFSLGLAANRWAAVYATAAYVDTAQVGSMTAFTLATGELGYAKITASGSAPGAASCKEAWVAGTNAGTCKKISYCGTSTTPTTIIDNVGGGC